MKRFVVGLIAGALLTGATLYALRGRLAAAWLWLDPGRLLELQAVSMDRASERVAAMRACLEAGLAGLRADARHADSSVVRGLPTARVYGLHTLDLDDDAALERLQQDLRAALAERGARVTHFMQAPRRGADVGALVHEGTLQLHYELEDWSGHVTVQVASEPPLLVATAVEYRL